MSDWTFESKSARKSRLRNERNQHEERARYEAAQEQGKWESQCLGLQLDDCDFTEKQKFVLTRIAEAAGIDIWA